MSMKYGFNKSQLKEMGNTLGMSFQHISALGIASDKRKNLETQSDYEVLFREYEQEMLPDRRAGRAVSVVISSTDCGSRNL